MQIITTEITKDEEEFFSAAAEVSIMRIKSRESTLLELNKEELLHKRVSPPEFNNLIKETIKYFSKTPMFTSMLRLAFALGPLSAYEELVVKKTTGNKLLFTQKIYPFKSTDNLAKLKNALKEAAIYVFLDEFNHEIGRKQKSENAASFVGYNEVRRMELLTKKLPELEGIF